MFQNVLKIPHRFQCFSNDVFQKCFQKFPIGFNDFQIVCFTVFSNNVFQSVFKNPHRFQWFSNCMFSKCVSKCFQKSPIGFNAFQVVCFKVFLKFLTGFNGFQIVCFIIPHRFQWFSNCVFK